jgi:putative membrane protein
MSSAKSDRKFFIFNAIVSTAALSLLAWLLILRDGESLGADLSFMPAMNAVLNSIAALFLASGWIAIVKGKRELHRYLMVGAFAASAIFLVGYLIYHYAHGDTPYPADAANRTLYFTVLISHIILSVPIVPLCLTQFYYARTKQFPKHRKVGRVLLPIWLYVSVTGVVIYFMLNAATGA